MVAYERPGRRPLAILDRAPGEGMEQEVEQVPGVAAV